MKWFENVKMLKQTLKNNKKKLEEVEYGSEIWNLLTDESNLIKHHLKLIEENQELKEQRLSLSLQLKDYKLIKEITLPNVLEENQELKEKVKTYKDLLHTIEEEVVKGMLASEIIAKFNKANYDFSLKVDRRKIWFEIELCENYGTYSSHNCYKFSKICEDDGNIILKNYKGKTVKILTKDNTAWISRIILRSRNIYAPLVNYHFAKLEVLDKV